MLRIAAALALGGLGSVGTGTAAATPIYRLAFGGTIDNAPSAGPLIISGHRASTAEPMIADQIVELSGGGTTTRPNIGQLVYEQYPGSVSHRHWHYKGFDRYQLRSVADLSLVRPDHKAGFCLSDPDYAPDYCGSLKPDALAVSEGMGAGTSDYYNPNLEGQYIDVTGVPPGDYWLVHWVNAAKEICESDYSNNAAAVKIALWPNGYGVAPYFTVKESVKPFPPLYGDLTPPSDCGEGASPAWVLPDLVQRTPSELSITRSGEDDQVIPPPIAPAPTPPSLSARLAARYVVRVLTQRFHRRPRRLHQSCRRTSETSFRCHVRWRSRRYRYRGIVWIRTVHTANGFERRFDLRVRRTDTRCTAKHRRRCSRVVTARNLRLRSSAARFD